MKRIWTLLMLALTIVSGCGNPSAVQPKASTSLWNQLGEIIKKSAGVQYESGGGGGSTNASPDFGHWDWTHSFKARTADKDKFDEKKFVQALEANVKTAVQDSGAKIVGGGTGGNDGFHLRYTERNVNGCVDGYVVPTENNCYKVIILIHGR